MRRVLSQMASVAMAARAAIGRRRVGQGAGAMVSIKCVRSVVAHGAMAKPAARPMAITGSIWRRIIVRT